MTGGPSPSILLWRNAGRDRVVEGSIFEVPRLLAVQKRGFRWAGQNYVQFPVFVIPRKNYHRVAKGPLRAGCLGK
jgi:hypothetical protein